MNETMKLTKAFIMLPVRLLVAIAASLPDKDSMMVIYSAIKL
jgi:hypothetical protein